MKGQCGHKHLILTAQELKLCIIALLDHRKIKSYKNSKI